MRNQADFDIDTQSPPYAARSDEEAPVVTIEFDITAYILQWATQNHTKDRWV